MRCTICGREMNASKAFCKYCGSYNQNMGTVSGSRNYDRDDTMPISFGSNETVAFDNYSSSDSHTPPQSGKKALIVVGALFIVALITLVANSIYNSQEPVETDEESWDRVMAELNAIDTEKMVDEMIAENGTTHDNEYKTENTPAYDSEYETEYEYVDYVEQFILEGDKRYYDISELYSFTREEVALIRNGMFALSGEVFDKAVNVNYFNSKDWYYGFTEDAHLYFNDYQQHNVDTCVEYEKLMGWR